MPTRKINDINIYYEMHGEGEPLILIPGLRNDVSEYEQIIASKSASYRVVALDNRGAGHTDKPDIYCCSFKVFRRVVTKDPNHDLLR